MRRLLAFTSRNAQRTGRSDGPSQTQDVDRPRLGIEHFRTRNHRSRRQGPHRQGVGGRSRRRRCTPRRRSSFAAPGARSSLLGRRSSLWHRRRPATPSSRRWWAPSTARRTRAPSPFVEVGSAVKEGDPICIIEAMKIMNEIEADTAGTITRDPVRERPGGRVRPTAVHHRMRRALPARWSSRLRASRCDDVQEDPDRQPRRDRPAHPARLPRAGQSSRWSSIPRPTATPSTSSSPTRRSASARRRRRRATSTCRRSSRPPR